ncbi:PREDICTED: uncharacterized protein LOC109217761 [Nicotiana attenuata]|uniref:uncharacterized protein LOC109217761 n=1 Tax=Nicotiana attenuata TaxID=49451 RepID=UPI0009058C65|nr:PREDICTED: uncharacterized protein LOC109217761 [Nicotiana attenuata]
MTTVQTLINIAVKKGWDVYQLDVNNAFLHGYLYEEVYIDVPQGLMMEDKSLKQGDQYVFMALYVDDVILTGTDFEEIIALKAFLHNQFKIKDLGKLHNFFGFEMLYKNDGVLIFQRKFTTDSLKEYDYLGYSHVSSQLDSSTKLKAEEGALFADPSYYRKLIGKLNFLTNTRLDIAYNADPTLGIFLYNDPSYEVTTYCDSDWAACPDSRRSVSGYLVLLRTSPISWKSKKQTTVSLSSAEAEYRSLRKVVGELVWVKRLLEELTVLCDAPIPVFYDSQAAVHIAKNPVFHERTKHIEVDCHFERDKLQDDLIILLHISTNN